MFDDPRNGIPYAYSDVFPHGHANAVMDGLSRALDGVGGGQYTLSQPLEVRGPVVLDSLSVLDGGTIETGVGAFIGVGSGARLELSPGSQTELWGNLAVEDGGELQIHQGGSVFVGSGGRFQLNPGSRFYASGTNIDFAVGSSIALTSGASLRVGSGASLRGGAGAVFAWSGPVTLSGATELPNVRSGALTGPLTVGPLGSVEFGDDSELVGRDGASLQWSGPAELTNFRNGLVTGELRSAASGRIWNRRRVIFAGNRLSTVSVDQGDLVLFVLLAASSHRLELQSAGADVGDIMRVVYPLASGGVTVAIEGSAQEFSLGPGNQRSWAEFVFGLGTWFFAGGA